MTLYGQYEHTIDAKNRVFVPAKYKEALGETFKLSYGGINKCILVYSEEEWSKFISKFLGKSEGESGDLKRIIFSNTVDVQLDSQGRIVIPNFLKEKIKLNKESVIKNLAILGVDDHLEIWSVEGLEEKYRSLDTESLNNRMIQMGI